MADSRQTRSTLKDFLATRGLSASGITLTPAPGDSPPTDAANEGDDLGIDPNTGLPVLGLNGIAAAYIAYLTQQAGSLYTLEPAGETAAPSNKGDPLAPPDQQGATRVFARPGTTLGQAMQLSNSGRQDATDYPITSYLDKTGGDPSLSGDSLLSSVTGRELDTTGNPQVDTYVDVATQSGRMQTGVLQSVDDENRASPQRAAVPVGTTSPQLDAANYQSVQRSFGTYQKDDTASAEAYAYEQIKDVGAWLLTSAAGYTITDQTTTGDFFESLSGAQNLSIPRASAVMRTKMGGGNLNFESVAPAEASGFPKQPDGTSMRQGRGSTAQIDEADARYTRPTPSTYTSETQFSDTTKLGNVRLSQARAYIAINKLASLLKIDTLVPVPTEEANALKSLGPYFMGGSIYSRINAMNRMLMDVVLVPTKRSYTEAVQAGMGVMLGKARGGTGSEEQITDYFGTLVNSSGFWESVASSAVDIIKSQTAPADTLSPQYYIDLGRSKAVKIMNVFATVGDIILQVTGREYNPDTALTDIRTAAGIEKVDDLPVSAGTRISKGRDGTGRSPLSLSWRGNSVPGLYLLSDDVIRTSLQMGNLLTGENPARGMLASTMIDKTYADPNMKGSNARIPGDIVKIVEDRLDAEYVPFYFHDLRTNEIIAFHAFLEQLSDSFSAAYTAYKGFGRADPVQTYSSTTRTLSLSFTVAATSRDDFDEMWYKLNRLIACVYPKYTPGQLVKNGDIEFEQPFSQVVGATPLMRLRVGDVVKSNYSRFNLARFFGIGSDGTDVSKFKANDNALGAIAGFFANPAEVISNISGGYFEKYQTIAFYGLFGSPVKSALAAASKLGLPDAAVNVINSTATSAVSTFLVNGFVNPIGYKLMTEVLFNPDGSQDGQQSLFEGDGVTGYQPNNQFARVSVYIKARERAYDVVDSQNNVIGKITVRRPLQARIRERYDVRRPLRSGERSETDPSVSIRNESTPTSETRYIAEIVDPTNFTFPAKRDGLTQDGFGKRVIVTHDELLPDLGSVFSPAAAIIDPFSTAVDTFFREVDSKLSAVNLNASSILDDASSTGVKGFMSPQNNAVVRAFEHNKGRGLAGVIKQLSFNWVDFNWETDWGARAPMGTKVTISFDCIHDLPPGLDAGGYMRAPTHNVGSIMNTISGDPHNDGGEISRQNFAREGASTVTKR